MLVFIINHILYNFRLSSSFASFEYKQLPLCEYNNILVVSIYVFAVYIMRYESFLEHNFVADIWFVLIKEVPMSILL